MSQEIYLKKKRFQNVKQYSPKLLGFASFPFILLLFVILCVVFYAGEPIKAMQVFAFILLCMIMLIPYLFFPIVNIFLLHIVPLYHDFMLGVIGIEGDQFTYGVVWFFVISYIILNYMFVTLSIIVTTLMIRESQSVLCEKFKFLSFSKKGQAGQLKEIRAKFRKPE